MFHIFKNTQTKWIDWVDIISMMRKESLLQLLKSFKIEECSKLCIDHVKKKIKHEEGWLVDKSNMYTMILGIIASWIECVVEYHGINTNLVMLREELSFVNSN